MKAFGLFLSVFGLSYFVIERVGLTSFAPPSNIDVLHSAPLLVLSTIILLYSIVAVSVTEKHKRIRPGWVWIISVSLVVAGLWISYLTRYDVEFVITEGQSIDIPGLRENPEKTLRGKYAMSPEMNVTLEELRPEFNDQETAIKSLGGTVKVHDVRGNTSSERVIGDAFPRLIKGYWMKFSGFGYSPRYVLKTANGKVLDSAYVYMDIFPPGKEDYFRLLSPVTYHLRYLPNKKDEKQEHSLNLRIVRNKEILFDGEIEPGVEVSFENGKISFPEIRMWSRLSFTRDRGLLPATLGVLILFFYLVLNVLRKIVQF